MDALAAPVWCRSPCHAAVVFLALVALGHAQTNPLINGVNNPAIGTGTQTLNPLDAFTGTITIGTAGQYSGSLNLSGNYTSTAGQAFSFTGNSSYLSYTSVPRMLTLVSGVALTRTGTGGTTYVYDNLVNGGTITVSGGTLQFQNGTAFTNSGTGNVTGPGSTLTLYNLTNTGNLIANSGGQLQLAGNFTTAGLGNISLTGASPGSVQITGNLDNTGATLGAPSGGAYTLSSGTIKNGTVTSSALSFSNSGGTIDNTTVNGDINIAGGASYTDQSLTLQNNTIVNGNIAVGTTGQYYGTLYFGSNLSLAANRNLTLTGIDSTLGNYYTPATLTIPATASLVRTGTDYSYIYANLNNAGNIVVNGGTVYLDANLTNAGNLTVSNGATLNQSYASIAFTNTGTANVTGAGSTLIAHNLTNTGNLIADSAGVLQLAGNFTTGNLGTIAITGGKPGAVQITGTLDNTGATLGAPSGGAYTLYGGTIKNGTITSAALAFSNDIGTLDNATVNGDITIAGGPSYTDQSLLLQNNTSINGNITVGTAGQYYGTLYLSSDLALAANHNLTLTGSASSLTYYYNQPTLTIPATASLLRTGAGYSYVYDTVANSGNIVVNGGTLYFDANLTNSGSVLVSSGANLTTSSYYPTVFINHGTANVTGSGSTLVVNNLTNTGNLIADSAGVLQLAGNFITSNLGTIAITGAKPGAIQITGTLDNTGATLSAPTGGTYTLYGGTIRNGTITSSALAFSNSDGVLDNATVNGDIIVAGSNGTSYSDQYLTLQNNTVVNGNITVGTAGQNYGTLYVGNNTALAPNKTLTLTGSSSSLSYYSGSLPTLTIPTTATLNRAGTGYTYVYDNLANSGNIVVNGGTLYSNANVTNSGSLLVSGGANFAQSYYYYGASTFNNTGTANVTGTNSTLTLYNLTNTGNLIADSAGVLQLAGNLTTAALGNISLTGATPGAIRITGNLDNTAANLGAPTGGPFTLYGGTIRNGTITSSALTYSNSGGTLDNATVNGDINVAGGPSSTEQSLTLQNNATVNGNITLGTAAQYYGSLYLGSNLSLAPNRSLTLTGSASSLTYNYGSTPILTVPATASLTRTGAGYSYVYDDLANSGNIVVSGGTLYLYANVTNSNSLLVSGGGNFAQSSYSSTFNNTGTANVTGANSTLTLYNLSNTGNLIADSAGVLQLAGSFATASLGNIIVTGATPGLVRLAGTLDNTGATLAAPTGGAYTLYGGTLRNGTVSGNALTFSNNGGTIDNATLNGDITVGANSTSSQYVYFVNNTTVTGNLTLGTAGQYGGTLYLGSNLSLATNANLTITGTNSYLSWTGSARQLTLGPTNTMLRTGAGYGSVADSIVNAGTISVTGGSLYTTGNVTNQANITVAAGTQLYSGSTPQFTQTAGVFRVDGTFNPPPTGLNISGGSLTGAGTLAGNVTFTAGTLDPGSSIGTLTFGGNLTLSGSTITNLELGAGVNDRIVVTGSNGLVFGGTLNILAVSTAFTSGQTWNLFNFTAHTGSFSSINLPNTANGWVWDASQLLTTGNLTLTTFVPVPEPSTDALLATGLGALLLAQRRRRR